MLDYYTCKKYKKDYKTSKKTCISIHELSEHNQMTVLFQLPYDYMKLKWFISFCSTNAGLLLMQKIQERFVNTHTDTHTDIKLVKKLASIFTNCQNIAR